MQDLTQRQKIMLAAGLLGALLLLVFAIVSITSSSDDELYETDPVTGREFFSDPEQAPETSQIEVVSLLQSQRVQEYFYADYLLQLRAQITDYLHDNVDESIQVVYVDSDTTYSEERVAEFKIRTLEPIESVHNVQARITITDVVETTITPVN